MGADVDEPSPTIRRSGSSVGDALKLWGGLALGVGMLGWFLASLDLDALVRVMAEVRWAWVALAAALMLADYAVHGLRWKVLLHHVDPDLDWRTLWGATTVLWGFNTLLPLRAGNFLRPAVVATRRHLPYTTLLFSSVAEYVCDIFGIVVLVVAMIWLLPAELVASGPLADVQLYGTVAGVVALGFLAAVVLLSTRRARAGVELLLSFLPGDALRRRAIVLFDQLVLGMAGVGHPGRFLLALVLTLAVWGGWLLAILATFRAFDLDLPLAGALFWESSLTLSMLVPQAPGYLGVFQVVTEQALALFDAPIAKAEAIALVFWTICFVPVTVLGVVDGARMGLSVTSGTAGNLPDPAPVDPR